MQPLAPKNAYLRFVDEGVVELTWDAQADPLEPSAKPTGYIVYTAAGSQGGFDNGELVQGRKIRIKLSPDAVYRFRVTATNKGGEFTHTQKTNRIHPLDVLCNRLHIVHKTIRPKTPWHNGKVERSHRNDQERFYNYLKFYSYEDLQIQMKRYLRRSNRIPMSVLGWKSPIQKRQELEAARFC